MKSFNKTSYLRILSLDNDFSEYCRLFAGMEQKSVYLLPSYLKAVQYAEKYPVQIMVLAQGDRTTMIPYIKRRINDLPLFRDLEHELWDIVTPHEYCYALCNAGDPMERGEFLHDLFEHVADYCREEKIVSEFIRFDPFLVDIECIESLFVCRKSCDNIYVDLHKDPSEIYGNFAHSVKKNIKRALSSVLTFYEAERTEENVKLFVNLYWASMRRLGASEYFYFSEDYFGALIRDCESAYLFVIQDNNNQPIAASILLYHESIGHHHLTGYLAEATQLRPNDYMIYSLIKWGQEHGMKYLHLGGGCEAICNFKGKFSNERIPYYVGYRIHDQVMYSYLCNIRQSRNGGSAHADYFPLYRAGR